jgi:CheY-like chemotaxis protein
VFPRVAKTKKSKSEVISKIEKVIDILLVEDSETDAELTLEALKQGKLRNTVSHVKDGEEALRYLRKEDEFKDAPRPDLILLDLNMPRVDGREVLRQVRQDESLQVIPVVVLTTSSHDKDILETYGLFANSYIVKPVDLSSFFEVIKEINNFWVKVVALPPK